MIISRALINNILETIPNDVYYHSQHNVWIKRISVQRWEEICMVDLYQYIIDILLDKELSHNEFDETLQVIQNIIEAKKTYRLITDIIPDDHLFLLNK